ncbi:hypothetical protein K439DRAFT_1614407 [Ramaria rubella]|nr:hypothetical protein K439DRAFT_1614407 [Ramaria rubella]
MLAPLDFPLMHRFSLDAMMHPVITASQPPPPAPFRPLAQLQVKQKIDWATECQTPLTENDDKDPVSNKDSAASPSPGSEEGSDQPSTPPNLTRRPSQKPAFANNGSAPFSWNSVTDDFMRLQISEPTGKKPATDDPVAASLDPSLDSVQLRDSRFPIHGSHLKFQPAAHSRASSGDTSSSEHSTAQLQINTAVGSALASKPFTAAPDARSRSFQESLITEAERKRLQPLTPVKMQGAEGPRTSPPREAQTQRFHSPEATPTPGGVHPPRFPTLQDQQPQSSQPQPTYPSIQHQQQVQFQHQQQQQQIQQHQQQAHRPPPINVTPGPGGLDFRMARPEDEYMQARLPNSAQFNPQGRIVSEGAAYRPAGPRSTQYPPMQMSGPGSILAPPGAGYPYAHPHPSPHLPLGPQTPQVYDLSLPGSPFRGAHQHSASDPAASLREQTAALALMHMHPFNVGGSPLPHAAMLYPQQFYPGAGAQVSAQDAYNMARIAQQSAQYPPNGIPTPSTASYGSAPGSAGSQNGANGQLGSGGPSANNRKLGLYKTELCRSWEEKGSCRYGPKCQFAHGEDEIRKVARHPKYKTEICRTFWVSGSCPYGKRCCFIHTELPVGQPAAPASGSPPADTPTSTSSSATAAGRERSMSTNSDPNDAPVSLLTRIANQRTADAQAAANNAAAAAASAASVSTPTEGSSTPTYQFPQQRPNSLRVDTSTLDAGLSMKQNKSAYPYMNNHSLPKNTDHVQLISPGPVTAGPDLGRGASRFDVYNERYNKQQQAQTPTTGQQTPTNTQSSSTLRHSFNGTENINLQAQLALSSGHSSPFGASQATEGNAPANNSGNVVNKTSPAPTHSRSDSASGGNWNTGFTRGLGVPPNAGSPWPGDLGVGSNRLSNTNNSNERKWS